MGTAEIGRWLPKLHAHLLPQYAGTSTSSPSSPGSRAVVADTDVAVDTVPLRRAGLRGTRRVADRDGARKNGGDVGMAGAGGDGARSTRAGQRDLAPPPRVMHGRPAMEIDAANVMAVLREFDRRFAD